MKHLFSLLALSLLSTSAYAWPGSEILRCKSEDGAQIPVALTIWKGESSADDMPAGVKIVFDSKTFESSEEDSAVKHIGFVSAPDDKVFTARYEQTIKGQQGYVKLWALADTFKKLDSESSSEEFYTFKARLHASIWNVNDGGPSVDNVIVECKHSYYHGS